MIEQETLCDICGKGHDPVVRERQASVGLDGGPAHEHCSLQTREWYCHFPHSVSESHRDTFYGGSRIPIRTSPHEHYHSLLYWQHLHEAYRLMFARHPARPVVAIHNYCGSYGMIKHMEPARRLKFRELDRWPLFCATAAGEYEGAIPGLFPLFFQQLVAVPTRSTISLDGLFEEVVCLYQQENPSLCEQAVGPGVASPCLMCRDFNGSEEQLGLCSVCHRSYQAQPEPKPDLRVLQSQLLQDQEASARGGIATAVQGGCVLRALVGDPGTGQITVGELLAGPGKGDGSCPGA